jgi:hypothetical protein
VVVLPEPDSPISASTSPGAMSKLSRGRWSARHRVRRRRVQALDLNLGAHQWSPRAARRQVVDQQVDRDGQLAMARAGATMAALPVGSAPMFSRTSEPQSASAAAR